MHPRYALDLEMIKHARAKAKSPQTKGICARFNHTIQNEVCASAFRHKLNLRLKHYKLILIDATFY